MGEPRYLVQSEGKGDDSIPGQAGKARGGTAMWVDTPMSLLPAGRSQALRLPLGTLTPENRECMCQP